MFTPLLPSTATGLLETRSIIEPMRKFCRRNDANEAKFLEMEVTAIDHVNNTIHCTDVSDVRGTVREVDLPYDYLIVAPGADTATFNTPGVKENSIYMKSK